jgi:hypothetical protein
MCQGDTGFWQWWIEAAAPPVLYPMLSREGKSPDVDWRLRLRRALIWTFEIEML